MTYCGFLEREIRTRLDRAGLTAVIVASGDLDENRRAEKLTSTPLKPWRERTSRAEQYQAIKVQLNQEFGKLPQGTVFSFSPPAIPGVGTSGGFTLVLEDRSGRSVAFLAANVDKFLAAARKRPEIGTVFTTLLPSVPQKFVDVDRQKVLKQGVAIGGVYQTIQTFMGGLFVNYFNEFGRTWQVYAEAEAPYRATLEDLGQFYVRNNQGQMVPLTALARFESRSGPEFTMRFDEYGSTSETNYFSAQLNLVQSQLNERLALVELYQALGGGWQRK